MKNFLTLVPDNKASKSPTSAVFVFPVSRWVRLESFLSMGAEKVEAVHATVAEDGLRVLRAVVKAREAGNARTEAALFALAVAAVKGDERTKRAAYRALVAVARSGDELARFVELVGELAPGPLSAA